MDTSTGLAIGTPRNELEALATWQNAADRRRRVAEAIRDRDRETLWSAFAAHLRAASDGQVSGHTYTSYRRAMNDLLDWCEAGRAEGRMAHQLTAEDAALYRLHLQVEGGRGGRPLATASVNARLAGTRAFMACLVWSGVCEADPFSAQARRTIRDRQPAEKRLPFTGAEIEALLQAATDPRDRVIVLLGADAGLRLAEVAGLRWQAVRLAAREILTLGKRGKVRQVPLTARLTVALAYLPRRDESSSVLGLSARSIQARFANLCKRAGVPREVVVSRPVADSHGEVREENRRIRRSYHSLRHAAATRLLQAGASVDVVAKILGHTHLETTMVYRSVDTTELHAAIGLLQASSGQ